MERRRSRPLSERCLPPPSRRHSRVPLLPGPSRLPLLALLLALLAGPHRLRRLAPAPTTPPRQRPRPGSGVPGHRHRRQRRADDRRAARGDRLDVGDRHRDALRDRRRRPGRGRRQHLQLPRGRADDRPVGLHPQRRGDRRVRPRPGGAQRRHERHRRRARRARRSRPCCSAPRRPSTTATRSSTTLGDATGHADEADEVVADMQDRIDAAVDVGAGRRRRARGSTTSSTRPSTPRRARTFIGSIYALFGLENIADGAPDAAGGYPQLSAEYVVGAGAGPDRAGRHQVLRPDGRGGRPARRPSTPCPPCRRAGSSPPTTTSPPAGARGSPTSPSRSPRALKG